MLCHIKIGEESWCSWSGCAAGAAIAKAERVFTCTAPSKAEAERRAKRLRPHFRRGRVHVVEGQCAHAVAP